MGLKEPTTMTTSPRLHTCCPHPCDCCPDCVACQAGVPARVVNGVHTPYVRVPPTPEELAALGIDPNTVPIHRGSSHALDPED